MTSSAVKGVPSENFTFWRRWKRQRVGSTSSHFSARPGSIVRSLPRLRQALVDVAVMGDRGRLVQRVGVERLEVALVGVADASRPRRAAPAAAGEAAAAANARERCEIVMPGISERAGGRIRRRGHGSPRL